MFRYDSVATALFANATTTASTSIVDAAVSGYKNRVADLANIGVSSVVVARKLRHSMCRLAKRTLKQALLFYEANICSMWRSVSPWCCSHRRHWRSTQNRMQLRWPLLRIGPMALCMPTLPAANAFIHISRRLWQSTAVLWHVAEDSCGIDPMRRIGC